MSFDSLKNEDYEEITKVESLSIAQSIGDRLCDKGIWHEDRCNWIGLTREGTSKDFKLMALALGPTVYGGSSGIALYLANLFSITGQENYRQTALGAIGHAFHCIGKIEKTHYLGFYSGLIGVAYAGAKIGSLVGEDILIESSFEIFQNLAKNQGDSRSNDIMSGKAGAILALNEIYKGTFHENIFLELSCRLGDKLIASAFKQNIGWSWPTMENIEKWHNLIGLGHGTSGIAISLLELYCQTNDLEYLEAATKAFDYEAFWFDQKNANWPNFRLDSYGYTGEEEQFHYSTSWCHGAPGIGLSRLRAYEILKDEKYRADLDSALRTSIKITNKEIHSFSGNNYSLCHGLGGIYELLIRTDQVFSQSKYEQLVEDLAIQALRKYLIQKKPWPCGIPGRETPGLMVGLAGIGYFFLRAHKPKEVMPILMPIF